MDRGRELDRLRALLEEHELIPDYEDDQLTVEEPWGHRLIYERVRATPYFPMSVAEVVRLLERRTARFSDTGGGSRRLGA
jgi:hypothetical protein